MDARSAFTAAESAALNLDWGKGMVLVKDTDIQDLKTRISAMASEGEEYKCQIFDVLTR